MTIGSGGATRMGAKIRQTLGALAPEDWATMLHYTGVTALVLVLGDAVRQRTFLVGSNLAIGAVVLLLARNRGAGRPLVNLLGGWYHLMTVPWGFISLKYVVGIGVPYRDDLLIQLDRALVGSDPTVWLERIARPWLTEYLQIVYMSYLIFPFLLAAPLYRKGVAFERYRFALALLFYITFWGYILVPAVGPRYTLEHLQTIPLTGLVWTRRLQSLVDFLTPFRADCFPSGHAAMPAAVFYFALRYVPRYALPVGGLAVSIIFSTVYLRYHYAVDVLVGLLLAAASVAISGTVYRSRGFSR